MSKILTEALHPSADVNASCIYGKLLFYATATGNIAAYG